MGALPRRLFRPSGLAARLLGRFSESGTVAAVAITATAAVTIVTLIPLVGTIVARLFAATIFVLATFALRLFGAVVAGEIGRVELVTLILEILVARAEALLLLLLPGAVVRKDAEIMIGELQIIFRIHPIARHLGIARHILVFLKKLGCIATRAVVDPVAVVAATPVTTIGAPVIVPTAIPATGLPVVDQELILAFTLPSFTENTVQSPS